MKINIDYYILPNYKLPNVEQRNLRDPDWKFFYDYKHIKKDCIPKFVANFKRILRKALDTQPDRTNKALESRPNNYVLNPVNTHRTYNDEKLPLKHRMEGIARYREHEDSINIKQSIINKLITAINGL